MRADVASFPAPPSELSAIAMMFDREFSKIARKMKAEERLYPAAVSHEALLAVDYFTSFPSVAVQLPGSGLYLTPAACYSVYPELAGRRVHVPLAVSTTATCGRNESTSTDVSLRLPIFRMREIVLFNEAAAVRRFRGRMSRAAVRLAKRFGIDAHLAPATDPFFGASLGKRLFQQIKELKVELRARGTAGEEMAIASFNLHETFFTSRFNIEGDDGVEVHSACAAFGIERWVDAYRARTIGSSDRPIA